MSNTHEQNNTITNIGLTEGFAEGKSRKIDNSFVTDNRKARRKVRKQKEAKISRKSYAEAVRNITEKDVDFSRIYANLVKYEKSNSSQIENSSPVLCTNSTHVTNHSCSSIEGKDTLFLTQYKEILSILEELEETANVSAINKTSLSGYSCSDTVFNLIFFQFQFTEIEIKILEKSLDYAPIQNKINEPEIKQDFEEFCRKMRFKWHFRNEPTPEFCTTPDFNPNSTWKPPNVSPSLELFLSQVEKDLFEISKTTLGYSNFSKEDWQSLRSLADDRNIVIKKADNGLYVVVWDRNDYTAEVEKQLNNKSVYKKVIFKEQILQDLAETSNNIFKSIKGKVKMTEKQLMYFIIA